MSGRGCRRRVYVICTESNHQDEPGYAQSGHIAEILVLRRTPDGEYYLTRAGDSSRTLSPRVPTPRILAESVLPFECSCGLAVLRQSEKLMPLVLSGFQKKDGDILIPLRTLIV